LIDEIAVARTGSPQRSAPAATGPCPARASVRAFTAFGGDAPEQTPARVGVERLELDAEVLRSVARAQRFRALIVESTLINLIHGPRLA
jgi:hypothetical protein